MKLFILRAVSFSMLSVSLYGVLGPETQAQTMSSEEYRYSSQRTAQNLPLTQRMILYNQSCENEAYYLPPYQNAVDKAVNVHYYNAKASRVSMDVRDMRSGQSYSYTLKPDGNSAWIGTIPPTAFSRNDELSITFIPYDMEGGRLTTLLSEVSYDVLDLPDAYTRRDLKDSRVRIISLQRQSDAGPSFNVYWPGLYFSKNSPYPVSARVTSSRSPENSVRELDPIPGKLGWFEFQVPSLWYTPGEEITVDFTTKEATRYNEPSKYPPDSNLAFYPIETVKFKTLARK